MKLRKLYKNELKVRQHARRFFVKRETAQNTSKGPKKLKMIKEKNTKKCTRCAWKQLTYNESVAAQYLFSKVTLTIQRNILAKKYIQPIL